MAGEAEAKPSAKRIMLALAPTLLLAALALMLLPRRTRPMRLKDLIDLSHEVNPGSQLLKVAEEPFQRVNRSLLDGELPEAVAENLGVAVCVVDAGQALFQLAQGLMAFNAASKVCDVEDHSEETKQACAVGIAYGLAGLSWSASFIALAVSDCAGSLDVRAACAADVSSLTGSFSYLASAISSMTLNCPQGGARDPEVLTAENSGGAVRRLGLSETVEEIQQLEANEAAKQAAVATCVFDVGHAAFWLARTGTSIAQSTLHCTEQNVAGEAGKTACAVDMSGVVGAATFAASTILLAVAGCPAVLDADNSDLFCAASIIDTVGLAGYFAQGFASISSTCGAQIA